MLSQRLNALQMIQLSIVFFGEIHFIRNAMSNKMIDSYNFIYSISSVSFLYMKIVSYNVNSDLTGALI